jgi:hypothetical protein
VTDPHPTAAPVETCPLCGTALVTGTADFAETPDETSDLDLGRAELRPGQMVQTTYCPNPECPGPDVGARV